MKPAQLRCIPRKWGKKFAKKSKTKKDETRERDGWPESPMARGNRRGPSDQLIKWARGNWRRWEGEGGDDQLIRSHPLAHPLAHPRRQRAGPGGGKGAGFQVISWSSVHPRCHPRCHRVHQHTHTHTHTHTRTHAHTHTDTPSAGVNRGPTSAHRVIIPPRGSGILHGPTLDGSPAIHQEIHRFNSAPADSCPETTTTTATTTTTTTTTTTATPLFSKSNPPPTTTKKKDKK